MCKTLFIPLLAALALTFTTRQALAADETSTTKRPAGAAPLPDRLTTLDGKSYEKVVLDRVEPDGLLVRFAPAGGGSGAAKLKFRNLPPELRERYGYDAARAANYEGAQARGEAVWRAENVAWAEQRQAALEEQAVREKQMQAEAEARRTEAEQAAAEAARQTQEQPVYYYPWWAPGFCDFGFHGGKRFHGNFHRPASGIRGRHVTPHMAPMRPAGR